MLFLIMHSNREGLLDQEFESVNYMLFNYFLVFIHRKQQACGFHDLSRATH